MLLLGVAGLFNVLERERVWWGLPANCAGGERETSRVTMGDGCSWPAVFPSCPFRKNTSLTNWKF